MCTLTVLPIWQASSLRDNPQPSWLITMNRDEAIDRPEGQPVHRKLSNEQLRYWYPTDVKSGGTWFGVHGAGYAAALLNRYQDAEQLERRKPGRRFTQSRGAIIPQLLACLPMHSHEPFDMKEWLKALPCEAMAPFDLYVFSQGGIARLTWTGREHSVFKQALTRGFFAFSSSVDAPEAGRVRESMYSEYLARLESPKTHCVPEHVIAQLHAQVYSSNPSLGFNMSRSGRHTKSISQAIIGTGAKCHRYLPRQDFPICR